MIIDENEFGRWDISARTMDRFTYLLQKTEKMLQRKAVDNTDETIVILIKKNQNATRRVNSLGSSQLADGIKNLCCLFILL